MIASAAMLDLSRGNFRSSSTHSWPKFKIVLIQKVRKKFYYFPLLYCSQNSWMVVVFPIQIFWMVIVFTIQIFWMVVVFTIQMFFTNEFWQVFLLFYNTNFEFLSGMFLPRNLNRSNSFYKGPRTCKVSKVQTLLVLGPLQKLLLPLKFRGSVPHHHHHTDG
jgi:hypothetical protein